jgi:beta-phosphoglucomutase-like phosphatase (HAD superfamily)
MELDCAHHVSDPLILDFDGILVDTSHCWFTVIAAMFANYGCDYNSAQRSYLTGRHPTAIGTVLAGAIGRPELAFRLGREAMSRGFEEVSRGVVGIPGATDLVRTLHGTRALAVASNTPHSVVERALEHTGIRDAFTLVVGSDDVLRPKPAPDVYVKACDLLDCTARSATAIEDSIPGIESAHSAGVHVIAISDQTPVRSTANESYSNMYDPGLIARLTAS